MLQVTLGEWGIVVGVGGPILILAGNFFAVKYGLNGTRSDVREIKTDVKSLMEGQAEVKAGLTGCQTDIQANRVEVRNVERRSEARDSDIEGRLDRHIEAKP
jgi:hypothetical protein